MRITTWGENIRLRNSQNNPNKNPKWWNHIAVRGSVNTKCRLEKNKYGSTRKTETKIMNFVSHTLIHSINDDDHMLFDMINFRKLKFLIKVNIFLSLRQSKLIFIKKTAMLIFIPKHIIYAVRYQAVTLYVDVMFF